MNWQKIETAPKGDGIYPVLDPIKILVWDGAYIYIAFWNGISWDDGDFFNDLGEMTHWMPLPPPPIDED